MSKQTILNRRDIDENKKGIAFNRILLVSMNILILTIIALVAIRTEHSMIDCEERLFEKLTKQKLPSEIIMFGISKELK